MNGTFVGTWSVSPNGRDQLQYADSWVESDEGRPISQSLGFLPGNAPQRGEVVSAYFENLLPDSKAIRERVARRYRLATTDAFTMLAEVGRDCAGALQILPDSMTPDDIETIQATPLNDTEIADILRGTLLPPTMRGAPQDEAPDDFRISIAGAQEKTALLKHIITGRWCLPHNATPTTHILKLPIGMVGHMKMDWRDSIENEWLCAQIIEAYGLPVAACEPVVFDDMKALSVARFDRRWVGRDPHDDRPWLLRLPQEDMCQATGTPPHLKYENEGGPGIDAVMDVLGNSLHPARDRRRFFLAQLLFWMLRAPDGHAKNFSVFIRPGGKVELTPLYDVLSAYPVLGDGPSQTSPNRVAMAMAIRGKSAHWKMTTIHLRHWLSLATRYGITTENGRSGAKLIEEIVGRTAQVIETIEARLPPGFPARVAERILNGLAAAAEALGQELMTNPTGITPPNGKNSR
ncbi:MULTISPECIES: type II toxin-antitoxin system HipA family toxin [Pandoraea]|uniref:type II toxin-antitoxin system HipA family toxin n=1 Tax=Pandoraea TaxID=93217 RepID=UPI001F5DECC1|nr:MULTISPECIES: type II toxin-antitoxin system HipA family toxin [Pandoraea]MCI3208162.1 toxin HipA [Pandoraea sp. LA3]MDN4586191.1 toxin HipA [Pandoraea capi]